MDSIKADEIDYSVFSVAEDAPFIAFLRRMLTRDQERRVTITDLLDDPYLTDRGKQPVDLFYTESDHVSETDSELQMSVVASVDEVSNHSLPSHKEL